MTPAERARLMVEHIPVQIKMFGIGESVERYIRSCLVEQVKDSTKELVEAAMVIVLTPETQAWLTEHDPKALAQLEEAIVRHEIHEPDMRPTGPDEEDVRLMREECEGGSEFMFDEIIKPQKEQP